ncbi:hypothetical protein CMU30_13800 [Elizabethkingia anophelis]|nr:hypothetical protein [Elizabethkingia anophelis]MDV3684352.1 hypothetical protein [Elizabethkingia anophelis]MDV3699694.1 hypothetical protein [Elizabethkingia anophelis]MDV3763653.1 hypothetical protein [Elizabethkingia anophelis]MDV3802613.1 hypothetical protein [Elizabethkingia anophelis]
MAVNSELIETIKASQLPRLDNPNTGDLIHAQGDDLSTTSLQFFIDKINNGYNGTMTTSTSVPNTGYYRYVVSSPGTYSNVSPPVTVTQQELDENFVFISIKDGVSQKELSKKPSSKISSWTAKSYVLGEQVYYNGSIYEASENTSSTDIPGNSFKWRPKVWVNLDSEDGALSYNRGLAIFRALNYFVGNSYTFTTLNKADYTIQNGVLKPDNTLVATGSERTIMNISVIGYDRFVFDGWRVRVTTANLPLYANIVGIKSDGSTEVILQCQDNSQPIGKETFDLDVSKFDYISVSWTYYSDVPDQPYLKIGKFDPNNTTLDSVKNYIDASKSDVETLKDLLKTFYNNGVFNEVLDKSKYTILSATLKNDNTTISSPWERTILDIPCVGFSTVDFDGWRVRTATGNISLYPTILGIKSDGTKVVLLNSQDNTLPTGKETFKGINIVDYVKLSIAWAYYNDVPSEYPIIKLNKPGGVDKPDYVKRYIDEKARAGGLSFKDFGAKCDGVTNDTQAFKDAINYLISIGGGKIYLPPGEMLINQTEIQRIGNPNAFSTIEIYGDYTPTGVFGSVGNIAVNHINSFVKCLDTDYDPDKGVFYTKMGTGSAWDYSYMTFVLRNIGIRTSNPSKINALNLTNFQQAVLENVNIDNGVYGGQADEPSYRTHGVAMPQVNNGAYCYMKNVSVSGFYDGVVPREHTVGDNLIINCCKTGLSMGSAFHPIQIKRVLIQKCHRQVEVITRNAGEPSYFDIQQLAIEAASANTIDPGHEWQLPDTYSVYDDNNKAMGYITYTYHVGGMGEGSFSKSPVGGSKLRIRQLGDLNYV